LAKLRKYYYFNFVDNIYDFNFSSKNNSYNVDDMPYALLWMGVLVDNSKVEFVAGEDNSYYVYSFLGRPISIDPEKAIIRLKDKYENIRSFYLSGLKYNELGHFTGFRSDIVSLSKQSNYMPVSAYLEYANGEQVFGVDDLMSEDDVVRVVWRDSRGPAVVMSQKFDEGMPVNQEESIINMAVFAR
jgi:hypothetical protein